MTTPADFFNKPVQGTITTKELKGKWVDSNGKSTDTSWSPEKYEFLYFDEAMHCYVCNVWYKEYAKVPLLISKDIVEEVQYN